MKDKTENLIVRILQNIQKDVSDLKVMRQEMREGFASVKFHMSGMVGDIFSHERRILNLEDDVLRLKNEQDFSGK